MENYSYFHGHPTLKSPCIGKCLCNEDVEEDAVLGPYRKTWKERFLGGTKTWTLLLLLLPFLLRLLLLSGVAAVWCCCSSCS